MHDLLHIADMFMLCSKKGNSYLLSLAKNMEFPYEKFGFWNNESKRV